MNRKLFKTVIAIMMTLIMTVSCFSLTAAAAEKPKIYVAFDYSESSNTLTATAKVKSTETSISAGMLFLEYNTTVLSANSSSVSFLGSASRAGVHSSEGEGYIGAAWYFNPPIEASDSYTSVAKITFSFKDGMSLSDLDESAILLCNDYSFLNSSGGYGKYGGAMLVYDNNYYYSDNSTVSVIFDEIPSAPAPVAVTGVTLSAETAALKVGESTTLTAAVAPDNAADKSVKWSSSDEAAATVDATGKVTAVAAGTATITVTTNDGSFTDTCAVTITAATPTEKTIKSLSAAKATTTVGKTPALPEKVTATYNDGSTAEVTVAWATIDSSKYAKEGTFEVTGTVAGTDITAKCTVTVTAAAPAEKTIVEIAPVKAAAVTGKAPTLPEKVTVTYSDKSTGEVAVKWAAIDSSKYAQAGSFEVTGTVEGTDLTAKCTVTVSDEKVITSIAKKSVSTTVNKVPSLPKTVKVTYSDNSTADLAVKWDSIDSTLFTKAGSFTVKGTVEGTDLKAECTVTVKAGSKGDDDDEKGTTPETGDSIVGVSIAAIAFLVSAMIAVLCAGAVRKHRTLQPADGTANGGYRQNYNRQPTNRYSSNNRRRYR